MNYFEHHINDYDEATSHLSAREDGIYHRLIRKYYAKERPLPPDLAKVQRWARCRDDEDRQAVVAVLEEFFELREDGYHQKTCDEVLAEFQAGQPEREQRSKLKKANEETRLSRYRLERSRLFQALQAFQVHAPWNISMARLRTMVAELEAKNAGPATAKSGKPATPATATETPPATATATPATATHYPLPTTHLIDSDGVVGAAAPPPPPAPKKSKKAAGQDEQPKTAATWDAYSTAYQARYGVEPVRNRVVNGQLSQFLDRIGADEAPRVAAFFVGHKGNLYAAAKHPVNLLLRDAEKLRTEWVTDDPGATQAQAAGTAFTRDRAEKGRAWMGQAARTPAPNTEDFIDMEAGNAARLADG